jgi:hypothetical protein
MLGRKLVRVVPRHPPVNDDAAVRPIASWHDLANREGPVIADRTPPAPREPAGIIAPGLPSCGIQLAVFWHSAPALAYARC